MVKSLSENLGKDELSTSQMKEYQVIVSFLFPTNEQTARAAIEETV
jgi:hypothetical protein